MAKFDEAAEVEKCKQYLLEQIQKETPNDAANCYNYSAAYQILVNTEIAKEDAAKPPTAEPDGNKK